MMGLEQIKEANADPKEYADSSMSDGQQRRNDVKGKAYWSETDPDDAWEGEKGLSNLSTAADHGRLNEELPLSEIGLHAEPINPVSGSGWQAEVADQRPDFRPVGSARKPWVAEQTMTQYVPTVEEQIKAPIQPMGDWEFETVQALSALGAQINIQEEDKLALREALRMYRRVRSKENRDAMIVAWANVDRHLTPASKQIEAIIRTIDAVAPPPVPGYNSKLSLNYAFKPIRDALAKLIKM